MRREILFPLLGFLGGFVVAGIIFWQPVSQPAGASAISDAVRKHEVVTFSAGERPRTRMAVSAQESDVGTPVSDSAAQPKGPAEIFHDAIGKLRDMDYGRRQAVIDSLVKQLRAAGPDGLQVLRDYFRAGEDVKFQNGYTMVDGVPMQSLRLALLNTLADWPGNGGLALTREILGTTSRISEASLAISQMEKCAPGVYRAEAIQTLQKLAAKFDAKDRAEAGGTALFEAMRKLKATELLPAAEAVAGSNPWSVPQFTSALDALPADAREQALQRLFSNEAVKNSLAGNVWMMQTLNYSEPVIAQNVAQIFATRADKKFRENFLQGIAQVGSISADTSADRVAKLQSRVAFLDAIAPQCNTPVLQERLQDAREALQSAISNPDDNGLTKRGAGTWILNSGASTSIGGTTVITSGALQISTTTNKK